MEIFEKNWTPLWGNVSYRIIEVKQKLDLCTFRRYWKLTCILINQEGFSSAYGRKSLGLNSNPVFISELLSGQLLTKA